MKRFLVFSDLDSTLLDEIYSFEKAENGLKLLKKKKIPLIICTSKTRKEIEVYRKKIGNKHPFISEDGGGIFIPKNYFSKKVDFDYDKKIKGYYVIELGVHYKNLVKILHGIEKRKEHKNVKVIAFNDMSVNDLMNDSGLNKEQARLAKSREYDEPFKLIGKKPAKAKFLRAINKKGMDYTKGGRYYHILGENDKGKAIKILKKIYKKEFECNSKNGKAKNSQIQIKTIGIGDNTNDKEMLKAVDKPYLVQRPNGKYKFKGRNIKGMRKVKGIGPVGWNKVILDLFLDLDNKKAEKLYGKSLEILKKFQLNNGAILASSPKGRYPYIYPRDHAVCILALIDAEMFGRAKNALKFVFDSQNKEGSFPQRLDKKGKDASYKPIQLDNTGLMLYCFAKYIEKTDDKGFLKKYNKKINKAVDYLKSQIYSEMHKHNKRKRKEKKEKKEEKYLFFTPNSIHEFPPYEKGLEVWANATCFGALKLLNKVRGKNKDKIDLKKLKKSMEKFFWDGNHFIKTIRIKESSSVAEEIDASSYALADFGVFEDDNKKIRKNVRVIENCLWHKKLGGICRYEKHIGRNNGGWGPWPHFTLMLCRHFIRLGKRKKADRYLSWILDISQNLQLPEHIATKKEFEEWVEESKNTGTLREDRKIMINNIRKSKPYEKGLAYSVLPLAWPHAEFVRTWNLYKKRFL
ncbi:HAD-IIB family hydrolase [Candidatus Pacearchaeota archaeon]|nr:HAD-IIB family hydrolase [Candidatus Pacearchaeota archaeon]